MNIQLSDHFTYRKLLRFALPSIIMMVFTSIYGVVDGLFVSNFVGKAALTAINLIMPYLILFGCSGFMIGTGGSALVSKTLGMGDHKKANEIFSMLVFFGIALGIVLTILGIILLRPVAILLGAEGLILKYCIDYGIILIAAATAYILQYVFQSFCTTAEKPKLSLTMMLVAGICNIVLDIFFVGVFGWGLIGAAVATAISQYLGAMIPLIYFLLPNSSLLRLGKFHFDGKALLRSCANGASELLSNLSMSVVGILYNTQLLRYAGEDGIAAYGVIMYVNFVFLAIFIGFVISTAPLIGFNYGADNREELKNIFRKSLIIISTVALLMTASALVLAKPLSLIFVSYDSALLQMTIRGFIIYALSYLICGFNIFGSSLFTALNNGLISAIISILRTLVFQIATIVVLPVLFGLDGVWAAIVAAEFAALMVTVFYIIKYRGRYHYA